MGYVWEETAYLQDNLDLKSLPRKGGIVRGL